MTVVVTALSNPKMFGKPRFAEVVEKAIDAGVITKKDRQSLKSYADFLTRGQRMSIGQQITCHQIHQKIARWDLEQDKEQLEQAISCALSKQFGIYPDAFGKANHPHLCYGIRFLGDDRFEVLNDGFRDKVWTYRFVSYDDLQAEQQAVLKPDMTAYLLISDKTN